MSNKIDLSKALAYLEKEGISVYKSDRYGWGYTGCDTDHFATQEDAIENALESF